MKIVNMRLPYVLLFAVLIGSGCVIGSRLNSHEINTLSSTDISPLQLRPSHHVDGFRLDIIRQTENDCTDDVGNTESDVPYHPMGFDLGNGLFFDMNKNLSFRMDRLFDIKEGEDYVIQVKRGRRVSYRTKKDDEICHRRNAILGINQDRCSRSEQKSDALRVFQNGRFCYEITDEKEAMYYAGRNRKRVWSITQEEEDQYSIKWRQRKRKRRYRLEENTIVLDNHYRLVHNEEDNSIAIYQINLGREFFLYEIKRGKNKIMVYNANNRGFKVEIYKEKMLVFNNKHLWYEFKKIE